MSKRQRRVIVGGVTLIILLGILIFVTFSGSQVAKKPSELKSDESLIGKPVRLSGKVAKGSFKSLKDHYEFEVTDGKARIKISYSGVLPNSFDEGREVIADGVYQKGVFKAENLLVKCPSKYVPKLEKGN